jgi:hypothetical protein
MVYSLLVAGAWGSLLVPLPGWAKGLLSVAFLGLGVLLLLFGWAGSYWDSNMTAGASSATSTLVTGVLLLLSRAAVLLRVILHALGAPPSS